MPDDTRSLFSAARGQPDLFAGLNPEQSLAARSTEGALLVLAGAGTGKTRVLTTRLAHILRSGLAFPSQILTVTFTNKAAREMRERTMKLIGSPGEDLRWLGTFHSVSARILRLYPEAAGLSSSSFTILDTDDQLRLLRQVIEALNIDHKRWNPRFLAGLIDSWKNRAIAPDRLPVEESERFADGRGAELYRIYQERLDRLNAVDFGDLIMRVTNLLQRDAGILAEFHRRFRYIMVDEYQDTNIAQYLWLRLLARGSGNICCVGDDDQSIYGWRGAEIDNILRFEKDFPGAQTIRLEQNYRSTGHILAAASGLVARNRQRLGKVLRCEAGDGDKVRVTGLWDGDAEAEHIADSIESWQGGGRNYAECAILVRAAWQMRAFEDCFIRRAIPYRVIGGPRFYERAEIRDILAYLRLIHSHEDDLAFERIVNQPRRGVGSASLGKLRSAARAGDFGMMQAIETVLGSGAIGSGRAKTGLRSFYTDIERWRGMLASHGHVAMTEAMLDESGYMAMLKSENSPQAQTRLDNLKELVRVLGEFKALDEFLEHVQLVMDASGGDGSKDQAQIMTLHAAKGLEWPRLFLPGWEEEVFPSPRSLDQGGGKGLEEERRLAHVGLTRSREQVDISFVANRLIHGRWQSVLPSRFIAELPPEHVEAVSATGYAGGPVRRVVPDRTVVTPMSEPPKRHWRPPEPPARAPARAQMADNGIAIGQRVRHRVFGVGVVMSANGRRLVVDFGSSGVKKLIADFVEPV